MLDQRDMRLVHVVFCVRLVRGFLPVFLRDRHGAEHRCHLSCVELALRRVCHGRVQAISDMPLLHSETRLRILPVDGPLSEPPLWDLCIGGDRAIQLSCICLFAAHIAPDMYW